HSVIAKKIFSLNLPKQLNNKLSIVLSRSIMFDKESYITINTKLSGSSRKCELGIVALTNMWPHLPYGKKCIGISELGNVKKVFLTRRTGRLFSSKGCNMKNMHTKEACTF
ncbi:hypothetical protein BCR43DRAFT_487297, partial [Syncephalastrum racemosum]